MSKAALSKSFFHELCLNLNPPPRHSFSWHPEYNPYFSSPQITPLPYNFHTNLSTPSLLNSAQIFSPAFHAILYVSTGLSLRAMTAAPTTALAVHREVILCFPFSVNFSDSFYYTSTLSSRSKPNPRLSESNSLPLDPPSSTYHGWPSPQCIPSHHKSFRIYTLALKVSGQFFLSSIGSALSKLSTPAEVRRIEFASA
jgi:hypothetical protein